MAKSHYSFKKRQKELAKKQKKEEKRLRKLEKKAQQVEAAGEPDDPGDDEAAETDPSPTDSDG
jgi:prefoldin subunit 5